MRDTIRKTRSYYDERNTSISNYSVLLTRMPSQVGAEARIRHLLEKGMGEPAQKAEEVMLINDVEELHHHLEEKKELVEEQQKWLCDPEHPDFNARLTEVGEKIKVKEEQLQREIREGAERLKEDNEPSEKAIVILPTEYARDLMIERFEELEGEELVKLFGEGAECMEVEVAP